MTTTRFLFLALLAACAAPAHNKPKPNPTGDTGTTLPTTGGGGTATGTATGTPGGTVTTEYDCTQPTPPPPFNIDSYGIETQEDFDFSLGGYLVYQSLNGYIVGTNKYGDETVLSPGTAGDPRGVHGLADGRIVIMSPWDGAIKIADPYTGGLEILAGGLNTPNGVEIDANGRIYFTTYGEVGWTDVDGLNNAIIYSWPGGAGYLSPNGTVLTADEQTLTVAVPNWSETHLVTFARLGPDEWDEPVILTSLPGFFSGLDQDVCGNYYTAEYSSGEVVRVLPDGTAEVIANLNGTGWAYSAVRFGPGHSGWDRDHLYVTSRNSEIFDITIGIPGRRHPTTP